MLQGYADTGAGTVDTMLDAMRGMLAGGGDSMAADPWREWVTRVAARMPGVGVCVPRSVLAISPSAADAYSSSTSINGGSNGSGA